MDVVVSPYHLTSRAPAALVSLLLAERAVTLMPAPLRTSNARDLANAAAALPRYRKLVESWQWSEALWQAGAIVPVVGEFDPYDDVRMVWEDLLSPGGGWSELAPLMRAGLFDDEAHYLDAVAGDVLKGGADPGICVPLIAGLDRFAVRHGLLVARSAPTSVAEKAEAAMGRRLFAFSIPVLRQSSGEVLGDVREDAAELLGELRGAMREASASAGDSAAAVSRAARDVQGELGELIQSAVKGSDRHDVRAVAGMATVTGVALPANAVLASSSKAAAAMIGMRNGGREEPGTLPVLDPLAGGEFVALVVKMVGMR
ncbi:MAG: hypothetical protein AMXMBFR58_15270 [Phycisphaerae bacterium]